MSHPDGWKDEEGDVTPEEIVVEWREIYDFVKAPPTSAHTCGCDPGANNWHCQFYPRCAFGRAEGRG